MKKYLISGMGPGEAGAARLVRHLEGIAKKNGWIMVYPYTHISLSRLFRQKNYIKLVSEIIKRMFMRAVFILKVLRIRNSKILLLHPQTIGYRYFIRLIFQNSHIYQYILDNSFFCIKSYNYKDGNECLQCLNDLNACDTSCNSFPVSYKKKSNLRFLKLYKELAPKITFLAQNISQKKLLQTHFGNESKIEVLGMYTGEILECQYTDLKADYIVYHGSEHESKGILYFLELAKELSDYTFIVPHKRQKHYPVLDNVRYKPCSWETGLNVLVKNAAIVMNPSLWSAPVEGALLKSLALNKKVIVVKSKYGFINEIPDDILLKLNAENVKSDAIEVRNYMTMDSLDRSQTKAWMTKYLEKSNYRINEFLVKC